MAHVDVGNGNKTSTLEQLQEWVRGTEALLGPIVVIGNDGSQTAGTFDQNNPANPGPNSDANVRQTNDGSAPPGKTKVCDGWPFVSGQVVHVVIYR